MKEKEVILVQKELLDEFIDKAEKFDQIQQQLAEKNKEIEFMATQLMPFQKSMSEICANYDRQREEEKENLKRHIKQLEKELDILSRNQLQNLNHDKEIRHQVCEEIRKKAKQDTHRGLYTITYADLYGIEKGE